MDGKVHKKSKNKLNIWIKYMSKEYMLLKQR